MAASKYVVLNRCFHEGELRHPGQIVELKDTKNVPRHFEPYKSGKESELDELRERCAKEGYYFEPGWGIDRLKELLGLELSPQKMWTSGKRKAEEQEEEDQE